MSNAASALADHAAGICSPEVPPSESSAVEVASATYLPAWWKQVIIAAAVLILSSCRAERAKADEPGYPARPALPVAVDGSDAWVFVDDNEAAPPAPILLRTPGSSQIDDSPLAAPSVRLTTPPLGHASVAARPLHLPLSQYHHQPPAALAAPGPADNCGLCGGDPLYSTALGARPFIGPSDEYLCDGGDFGTPAGVRADWTIEGLEQEDAIAHYDTLDGEVIVTPSNRVCVYAPRFAAVRRVVSLMAHERQQSIDVFVDDRAPVRAVDLQPVASSVQRHSATMNIGEMPPILFRDRQQAGGLENLQATMDVYDSLSTYANLQIVRTGQLENSEKPRLAQAIESAITWTGDQAAQVVFDARAAQAMRGIRQAGIVYQTDGPDSPRLRLVKLASTGHALPGEEVEFTLRFDNIGDQVIGNVTIADNLSTRLEYVPESAVSSVDANFVTEPNSGGSQILRWEIAEPVKPGDGGVLRFRARVR